MSDTVQISVTLRLSTCGTCGTVYAVPTWVGFARCPMCAGRRILELEARNDRLLRREQGLRGAVSRARKAARHA